MDFLDSKVIDDIWFDKVENCEKDNIDELLDIKPDLISKYNIYSSFIQCNNVTNSGFLSHRVLLKDYYDNPPVLLKKELLTKRNNHGLIKCPFCGNPNKPNTLDHFIPKDDWPEFSIYPNNLVQQCRECAPIKGKKYFSTIDNSIMFFHPFYHSELSKVRFKIEIDFNSVYNSVNFNVKYSADEVITDITRLKLHIKTLKLNSRIRNYCNETVNTWKNKLKQNNFNISDALTSRLNEIPEGIQQKDWESALFIAILGNENLINYLNGLCNNINANESISSREIDLDI